MIIPLRTFIDSPNRRTCVNVPNNNYLTALSRQRGFQMRLHYEYEYCKLCNGKCYFITLTYNDNALLRLFGENWCNNDSFRQLMINKVYKSLLRRYNCSCRYFCAGELGEGKGSRGVGNNPHFHCLFFVYLNAPKPLKRIYKNSQRVNVVDNQHIGRIPNANEFMAIVSDYWRGNVANPQDAPFGICSYSKGNPEILGDGAFNYVVKYCIKDSCYKDKYNILLDKVRSYLTTMFDWSSKSFFDKYELKDVLRDFSDSFKFKFDNALSITCYLDCVVTYLMDRGYVLSLGLLSFICKVTCMRLSKHLLPVVHISNGLGLYGIDFVSDWTNPKLPLKTSKGLLKMPIPLYFYRKKFCNTIYYVRNGRKNVRYIKNKFFEDTFNHFEVFKQRILRSYNNLLIQISPNVSLSNDTIYRFLSSIGVTYYRTPCSISDLSRSDLLHFVVYNSVYFGRIANISISYFSSPLYIAFWDFLRFQQSDKEYSISNVPFTDYVPFNSVFSDLIPQFQCIYNFLLYLNYFKDNDKVQKCNTWRLIHRKIYSQTY